MAILEKEFKQFIFHIRFPLLFVVLMWIVHIYNSANGYYLNHWGIFPRAWEGLRGIITAPLIHGDYHHLISNTLPMLMLLSMMSIFYKRVVAASFGIIYLLTGATVWMFARDVTHIGASGVVYGLVTFMFWTGVFRRNIRSIVLSLVVVILYHGYLGGILPDQPGISWESHLFGAIVGIFVAYLFKDVLEKDEVVDDPWKDERKGERFFLPSDAFDKTKLQRLQERERQRQIGDRD